MAYAIYLLKHRVVKFTNSSPASMADGLVHDATFKSRSKEHHSVVKDAVVHVLDQFHRMQADRMPSELESAYTYEKYGMLGSEPGHSGNMSNIHIAAALEYVPDLLRTLRLEVLYTFDEPTCDLIDEALEIIGDKDITVALLPYQKPSVNVVQAVQSIGDINLRVDRLLSTAALDNLQEKVEALSESIEAYGKLITIEKEPS